MPDSTIRIALVILEDEKGRVAMQLRSENPEIANPGKWGVFGGHLEEAETPLEGAVREVEEELSCRLDTSKMDFLAEDWRNPTAHYFLFHYPFRAELSEATLTEGERWALLSSDQIKQGELDGKPIVNYHREYILAFWGGKYQEDGSVLTW